MKLQKEVYLYVEAHPEKTGVSGFCWHTSRGEMGAGVLIENINRTYIYGILNFIAVQSPQNFDLYVSNELFLKDFKLYQESKVMFFKDREENSLLWQRFDKQITPLEHMINIELSLDHEFMIKSKLRTQKILGVNK